MSRPRLLIALAAALALVPAATASGATVDALGGGLTIRAAAGEANDLRVTLGNGTFSVAENGPFSVLNPGFGCSAPARGRVACSAAGLSRVTIEAGDGADTIVVEGDVAATIDDGPGDDHVTGGPRGDLFVGGLGSDVLSGGPGDDSFGDAGGAGADVVDGGPGADTADYGGRTAAVSVVLDGVAADGVAGEGDDVRASVEHVRGGSAGDRLVGAAGANNLYGGAGDDTLDGGGGADLLRGDGGRDRADYSARAAGVTVTLDGVANDAGEADNADVEDVTGSAGADTITGSPVANALDGGAGSDTLSGGAGEDAVSGGDGEDRLFGGDHADAVSGGDGDDDLDGGEGNDDLAGGAGRDDHFGRGGSDTVDYRERTDALVVDTASGTGPGGERLDGVEGVLGGSGNDRLSGGTGDGRFDGGAGDDVLDGGPGRDRLAGGPGRDRADYGDHGAGVTVSLNDSADDGARGEGDDVRRDVEEVAGSRYDDRLTGDGDADLLLGDGGNDTVSGEGGDDRVDGGSGHDDLRGGAGRDSVAGASGDDRLAGGADADDLGGAAGHDRLYGEDGGDVLDGGDGNDQLEGGRDGDVVNAAAGADRAWGGDGDDTVDGGSGDDTADGQNGNDAVRGASGNDKLGGGEGNDGLEGGDGSDSVYGGGGDDSADGGESNDTVEGQGGNDRVSGGGGADKAYGGDGDDDVQGGDGGDTVTGGAGNDAAGGGNDGDKVYGDGGNDVLDAGEGDDAAYGGEGDDRVDGGGGNDDVQGSGGDDAPSGGEGDDKVSGGDGADRLRGDGGADKLAGNGGDDVLVGGAGPDRMEGNDGEDTVDYGERVGGVRVTNDGKADDGERGEADDVRESVDHAIGGAGNDVLRFRVDWPHRLYGEGGNDTLDGGPKADTLVGGPGADQLVGRGGKDRFDGGVGNDRLSGADAIAEQLVCGAGRDLAVKDKKIDKAVGCEQQKIGKPSVDDGRGGGATEDATPDTNDLVPVESAPGKQTGVKRVMTRGRFVAIPGSPGERIDSRLLRDVAYLKAKYKIAITDGFALSGHARDGEHPVGLALDIVPGPGGSWSDVDRLAKWAEPRQNRPRAPFRWVGYNGDTGHGRGHHLHLSWNHARTGRGRPAPWVDTFSFKQNRAVQPLSARKLTGLAARSNFRLGGKPTVSSGLRPLPRCRGPRQLVATWRAAARAFGLRASVLAAITEIESAHGCNMGPSSAGAIGWTQFMPGTWKMWGMDADGDRKASPYSSVDAIFSTARYLRASGAPRSYRKALFAYNHATWYVNKVLARAKAYQ